MNGGESRTDIAIARMLDELKYQSEINQSSVFKYTSQYVKGIGRYLDIPEQYHLLELMDTKKYIELKKQKVHNNASSGFLLIEGADSNLTQSLMTNEYLVDVTQTEWPQTTTTANESVPKHTARLLFDDIDLKIEFDDARLITVRRFQNTNPQSDTHKIFVQLFNARIGTVHNLRDIFPSNYSNLTKLIRDAKLSYLLPVFFIDKGSKQLQLRDMPVEIDDATYKLLLSKGK